MLEQAEAPYELHEFEAEEFTAEEVAKKLNIPIEAVFKTLVVRGDKGGEALAVVPGNKELNLKKLASVLGGKRADLVQLNEIQRLTGYLKGGVSPLGTKRQMPVLIDQSCRLQSMISVSAGLRGLQIFIAPEQLIAVAKAQVAALT